MKQTRVQEQRFLPWTHEAHGLGLRILGGQLDAEALEVVDHRTHLLDLTGPWQRAQLELEVSVPGRLVAHVLPKHEHQHPPLSILVVLRCARTYLRRCECLFPWTNGESGRFRATLELDRDELADLVELDTYLIRSRALDKAVPGIAGVSGARLANARSWLLRIDEGPKRSGNYLDLQYRSFSRDSMIPPSRRKALYRLDLDRDDPILYLNADHERVRLVLDSKGTRGVRARARDLLYERIEAGVWTQLLVHVSARLADDGELAYTWQEAVLELWLPRLYPELPSARTRREHLCLDYQRLPTLLAAFDAVLQTAGELASVATKLADDAG